MSTETRPNDPRPTISIYTVYPAEHRFNRNYEFFRSNQHAPHAPPPKYEDVINEGRGEELPPPQSFRTCEEAQQTGIVFVAPAYNYSTFHKTIVSVFVIIFFIAFGFFFVKFFRF